MRIDLWTLALQTINVLVLIWLLSRFLYKPVLAAIAARQAAAEKLLSDAQGVQDQAQAATTELKAKTDAFAAEQDSQQAQAQAAAAAERATLLNKASQDAAKIQAQAKAALAGERQAAGKAMEHDAGSLAVTIAQKLLRRLPPGAAKEPLFHALLDQLRALPQADRERITAAGTPIEIVTAEPLDEADQSRFHAALATALPGLTGVSFRDDPTLISGVEMHGQDMVVSNSWRADLATIADELSAVRDAPPQDAAAIDPPKVAHAA